jgi:hypothetical protein
MSSLPPPQRAAIDRLQTASVGVGVATLLACIIGAPFSPTQFFRAYLSAYLFYLGLGLGCLGILMIYYLTGGAWGFLTRRLFEAGMRTLPLLAILFTPIACGLGYLYLWAQPDQVAVDKGLLHKQIYLNAPFFWVRAALYFVTWLLIAYFLNAWSRRQDETDDPALPRKLIRLSAAGLVVYGITITFASVDWVMSLQPAFHSSIFGPLFASGQLLSGYALVVIVLAWLAGRPPVSGVISLEVLNDVGNLLLTLLIIWAYMVWFQFMLIWIANLPSDVIWYVPRSRGGWEWVAWALFVFHFAIPFFLLLMRNVKRDPASLAMTAGLILFMQLVFMYYQVVPAFPEAAHLGEHWMDFLTPFGVGGIWLAYFLWQLKRRPVLPQHDLNREEAVHLRRMDAEEAARQEVIQHG